MLESNELDLEKLVAEKRRNAQSELTIEARAQGHGAKQVQIEIFDTDHSFTNVRSQLADRIVSWLKID